MSEKSSELDFDEIIQETEKISEKLKQFKEVAKQMKKIEKKEKKAPQPKQLLKLRKIREDAILYRGGLSLFQYKESAINAGFQNPIELTLKDVVKDLYDPKPKPERKKKNKKGTDFTIFLKEDNNAVVCHSTVDINKLRNE